MSDESSQNVNRKFFLAKHDNNGNSIWIKYLESLGADVAGNSVTSDINGNIYAIGYTYGKISNESQKGILDYFIAKYDNNGNLLWVKQVGGSGGYTNGTGIFSGTNQNIYVTGFTSVGLSGESQNGIRDYFIAKYDKDGNLSWAKQVGNPGSQTGTYGASIVTDNNKNVFVAGYTDIGISGQSKQGSTDYFIAKWQQSI